MTESGARGSRKLAPDPGRQHLESRIAAQRGERRVEANRRQPVDPLVQRPIERRESGVVLAQRDPHLCRVVRGDIAVPGLRLELGQERPRLGSAGG